MRGVSQRGQHLRMRQALVLLDRLEASPAASAPTTVATSTRVPVRQALPWRIPRCIETPGKTSLQCFLQAGV